MSSINTLPMKVNAIRVVTASACVWIFISSISFAQYPGGTGTTGATDGSGRGTGSAGVQTGGGPDTSQSGSPQPINIFASQANVTTTTTTTTTAATTTSGGEKKQKPQKKSKKTTKQSQATTSPSPTASPR